MKIKSDSDIFYQLAVLQIPTIGNTTLKKLFDTGITPEYLLQANKKQLSELAILSASQIKAILSYKINTNDIYLHISHLQKLQLQTAFISEPHYPQRLLDCNDPPPIIFTKGVSSLNAKKIISVIGTRNHTHYGTKVTEQLISDLKDTPDLVIISGLATGIDGIAHKTALKYNIPTIGVLGHGHDIMYPASHKQLAKDMETNGAVISEYLPFSKPDKSNFPMRNRIVAGMADITIVVESKIKGGAIITAKLACGYNRTLGAVPGSIFEPASKGCNQLLTDQLAIPITSGSDILYAMNWITNTAKPQQKVLFEDVSEEESQVLDILKQHSTIHTDDLMLQLNIGYSQLASLLLQLELKGIVESLAGKRIALSTNNNHY